jgi:spore germination protein YaaH
MSLPTFRYRSLLVFLAAAGLVAAWLPATPAAAATPAGAHPSEMQLASDRLSQAPPKPVPPKATAPAPRAGAATTAARPLKEVFGFAQATGLGSTTGVGWNTWNFSALSTVAYFGVHVDNNGHIDTTDTGWSFWGGSNRSETQSMINAARSAGARVVLTIVSQKNNLDECTTLQNWATTVGDTVYQVQNQFPGQIAGVNVDYESVQSGCGGSTNRDLLRQLVAGLRSGLGAGAHLTVDTYGSSAADSGGFFDVPGMAPYVTGFFVMAYDLDDSNWSSSPLNCSSYCFSPNSPLTTYSWNDTKIVQQYVAAAGAGKTILGLPYYGWTACVNAAAANAYPNSSPNWKAPTYDVSVSVATDPTYAPYYSHRDGYDPTSRWDNYYNSAYSCTRETYWNDVASLDAKYDWVNQSGIEGVGMWSLDYGGGHSELWDALISHFTTLPTAPAGVAAYPGNTFATVSWSPPSSPAPITGYTIRAYDGASTTAAVIASAAGSAITATVPGLTNGHSYTFTVTAANTYGAGQASDPTAAVVPGPPPGAWPGRYHAVAPTRVIDTRTGQGGLTKLGPRTLDAVDVLGLAGISHSSGTAAVVNVTVTDASAPTYVSVTPTASNPAAVSTVNIAPGTQAAANLAQVALGADGKVQLYNSAGSADVIVDLLGWVGTNADLSGDGHYGPITPTRVLDTRTASQGFGALGPGQTVRVQVSGVNGVPAGSSAVVNLTAVGGTAPSYLTAWADGASKPGTSNLNFSSQTIANRVVVPLSSTGAVDLYNSAGTVDVLVDVVGVYSSSGATYTGAYPLRVVDTRNGVGGTSPLGAGSWLAVQIAGQPGLPGTGVRAVVINLTSTNPTAYSYLAANSAASAPGTSDLNFYPGQTIANLAVVPVGADGKIYIYNSVGSTDVLVDVFGWYA